MRSPDFRPRIWLLTVPINFVMGQVPQAAASGSLCSSFPSFASTRGFAWSWLRVCLCGCFPACVLRHVVSSTNQTAALQTSGKSSAGLKSAGPRGLSPVAGGCRFDSRQGPCGEGFSQVAGGCPSLLG